MPRAKEVDPATLSLSDAAFYKLRNRRQEIRLYLFSASVPNKKQVNNKFSNLNLTLP